MNMLPYGMIVEVSVAILLIMTIAYCFILNNRLKKLHADKDALKQMVSDLVKATNMANSAIAGLKESANEADMILSARLKEADKFALELANHVNAGQAVIQKIAQITDAASIKKQEKKVSANSALQKLREFQRRRENAA